MSRQTTEYVVLQATVNGLVREDRQGELDRHAGNGYHIAHALAHYIVMERTITPQEGDGRERA